MSYVAHQADRIGDLMLPERAGIAPPNVRQSDLDLLAHAPKGYMDTTHFDTVRFPPPDWALDRFAEAARDGALAYTGYRGHEGVLAEVARNAGAFIGLDLDPGQNVILTPGTQAALFAVLSARINPGEKVAVFDPDYLFTARVLRFLGAEVVYVPLQLRDGKYTPDLERLEHAFARQGARHLVFSHPNNPTGAVYPKPVIAAIADLCRRYEVSALVDELYSRLVYEGTPFHHLAAEPGMFAQTATLLGPSKTESLSGYRLGVVIGDAPLMTAVENMLSVTSLRAPAYAQHILSGWLGPDAEWLEDRIGQFKLLRTQTLEALAPLAWLKLAPQMGTAYLWPDVSALGMSDMDIARALLVDAGVLVSPGYQFGPTANGHFRLCYARDDKAWAEALDRITRVLSELAEKRGVA